MQMALFNIANSVMSLLGGRFDGLEDMPPWVENVIDPILDIMDILLPVLLIVIGTAGSIYAIVLGVNFARAETSDKREEAKKRLLNVVIGLVIIIVMLVVLTVLVANVGDIVVWINGHGDAA